MTSIFTLPNELLLKLFSEMELTDLLVSRIVCTRWNELIPKAPMPSTRRRLFKLYLTLVASPIFLETRGWVIKNLVPFDRREYIRRLSRQYTPLCEQFTMWVLEWPARAVFLGIWPGILRRQYSSEESDNINVSSGTVWLSYPQVSALSCQVSHTGQNEHTPIITIRRSIGGLADILLLDKRPDMHGKVLPWAPLHGYSSPHKTIPPTHIHVDWVDYLEELWKEIAIRAEKMKEEGLPIAKPDNQSLPSPLKAVDIRDLDMIPWTRRFEGDNGVL